ncbi:MAG: TonB-dependent receptor [Cyanobacteria bacterium P01_H01_bin.21]
MVSFSIHLGAVSPLVAVLLVSTLQTRPVLANQSQSSLSHIIDELYSQTNPITITNVQLSETNSETVLVLETDGELSEPVTSISGNTSISDISNAVLALSEGDNFSVVDPTENITKITVTSLTDNQVRVEIMGRDVPPAIEIGSDATGLVLTVVDRVDIANDVGDDTLRIVVTGEGTDDDYFVPNTSTATRTDTPLRDIPQSIQVIPRQVIEDQQATSIEEVLENAASVTFLGDVDSQGLNFAVRGFDDAPLLRDGFRLIGFAGSGGATTPEVANLERVEVLKGPASVLYGQAEPGGLINLVSKQPLSEPYYNLQLQGGNREISPSIDLSGPLTEDGRVLYRLNALYRYEDSFRDFDTSFDRFFIAPTLSWAISDRTDLTFNLEYIDDNDPADFGTVLVGDGDTVIPDDRVINNPEDTIEKEYLSLGYTFEHRFSDNWQLRNRFSFISDEFDYSVVDLPFFFDETTGTVTRGFTDRDSDDDFLSLYTNLQGKFNTGSIEHTLLFGVDVSRSEGSSITRFAPTPEFITFLDIFNPDYSTPSPDSESIPIAFGSDITTDRLGIYVQDQIDLLDNLILAAGLRYDTVDQETTDILTDLETDRFDDAVTPRIGIVYQPIEPISLYANYAQSFNPNGGTDAQGQAFDPQEGEGFEVGVRAELLENRLTATLAYFDITKNNVLVADPNVPFASIATGEQRSQGIDLDIIGEILPGWNIVASYAYLDAEITEATTDIVGNRLIGIPEHSASLWTTYQIQSGNLEGLGFGLGFNFVDERQGDLANSFAADSYFTTNAAVFYRRDNWRLGLNIDNLFDVDYIESVDGFNFRQVQPGDPFTVRASVSYTF